MLPLVLTALMIADGDLNEDSVGVTGLGCPAGNDAEGSLVFSHLQRELSVSYLEILLLFTSISFRCFHKNFQRGWNRHWF